MRDTEILCACGCGQAIKKARYPSQQSKFINTHQHRGEHNGNYRGGKIKKACPICLKSFLGWPSQHEITCGNDSCYRQWQSLTTKARGRNKISVICDYCGKEFLRFPSQLKKKNYCNRSCLGKTKGHDNNGNWQGGKWRWFQGQVLIRDKNQCVICGFDLVVHVHHIIGRKQGGKDEFSNLVTLCPNHHCLADLKMIDQEVLKSLATEPEAPPSLDDSASR